MCLFLLLNITFVRFSYCCEQFEILILHGKIVFHCVNIYNLFFFSIFAGHLGSFQFEAFTNRVTVKIPPHGSY